MNFDTMLEMKHWLVGVLLSFIGFEGGMWD